MATIDPNIAMGVRPIQIENPLNQYAAISQIQGAQQGQQLNALKMRQAQQEFESQNALANAYKNAITPEGNVNYNALIPQLAAGGAGSAIPGVLKTRKEAEQAAATLEKTQTETKAEKLKLIREKTADLVNNPSPENIKAHAQDGLIQGAWTPEQADNFVQQALSVPIDQRAAFFKEQSLNAEKRITTAETARTNLAREKNAAEQLGVSKGQLGVSQQRLGLEQNKALREQTMGTIPAGYRLSADGTSLEPIPGGPTTTPLAPKELQAREAKFPQATQALKTFDSAADNLISDLERLKNHPGLSNITGVIAGRTPSLTAQGREAQALYKKIIARGGFQELQNLRQSSPTGGALGNVSNQENQSLREAFGALDQTQDASSVKNEIDRIVTNIGGSKNRVREAFDMTYDYKNNAPRSNAAPPAAPNQTKSGATVSNW